MKQDDRIIDPNQAIWVAGHNDLGYSPDPDNVTAFATQAAARDYIADEIERLADGLDAVAWDTDEPDELADSAHADAENVRHNADQDYGDEFSVHVEDGRALPTSFWVQRSTLGERYDLNQDDRMALPPELERDEEFQSLLEELPEVGEVYATATSLTPVYDAENDVTDGVEHSGWVDPNWSRVDLHDEMEDVRPLWRGTDPAEAGRAVKDFLGAVEPAETAGSRGTYYGSDGEQPTDVTFSYAAHVWGWGPDKIAQVDAEVFSPIEDAIPRQQLAALHERAIAVQAAQQAQARACSI